MPLDRSFFLPIRFWQLPVTTPGTPSMTNDWGGVSREEALIEPEQVTNEDLLILWNMLWDIHSQNDGIGRNLEVMMMFVPGCYTGPHLCRFFPFLVVDSNAFFRSKSYSVFEYPPGSIFNKRSFYYGNFPIPPCKQVAEGVLSVSEKCWI